MHLWYPLWAALGCETRLTEPPEIVFSSTAPIGGLIGCEERATALDDEPGVEVLSAGDVTGDGHVDVVLSLDGGVGLLPGPFDGVTKTAADVIPWPAVDLPVVLDADGVPPLDLTFYTSDYTPWVQLGPLTGPAVELAIPVDRYLRDINLDGIADMWALDLRDSVRITWGPASRFSGPPDVVVEGLSAPPPLWWCFGYEQNVVLPGDVDGDGRPELVIANEGHSCGWTLSLLESGVIDIATSPDTIDAATPYGAVSVDDVDGDGLRDLLTATALGLAPLVQTTPEDSEGAQLDPTRWVYFEEEVLWVRATPYDLDRDGAREWLVRRVAEGRPRSAAWVPATLDALTLIPPTTCEWEFDDPPVLAEDVGGPILFGVDGDAVVWVRPGPRLAR